MPLQYTNAWLFKEISICCWSVFYIYSRASTIKTTLSLAIFDPHPPLIVHEMIQGLSHLYPALPIVTFIAMVSLLLLIPGFWNTRIVALVAVFGWLFLANLLNFIGMIYWRGHTNDAPVLASIRESCIPSSDET
jgi:hypothetical protein